MKKVIVFVFFVVLVVLTEVACKRPGSCPSTQYELTNLKEIIPYNIYTNTLLLAHNPVSTKNLSLILDFDTRKIAANFSFISSAYATPPSAPLRNKFYFDSIQVLVNNSIFSTFNSLNWLENYRNGFYSRDSIMILNINESSSSKASVGFYKTTSTLDTAAFTVKVFDKNNGVSEVSTVPLIIKN